MAASHLTWGGFFLRWLAALVLVFATYNPFGFSYVDWIANGGEKSIPLVILVGILLVIGFVIYLRATFRSIGAFGILIAGAFFAVLIWLLADFQLVDLNSFQAIAAIALVVIATIMAIGISWSFIRRRLTGQYDVDETDE